MSVEIPVVAIAFGSVTPPQGDISELRVHLGCTKEVSSFECLLQNFDKEYTVTNPINVGDNCSISIGRGANCPLILTGRVEEIEPESTPVENYIRVKGRCWGEKIFRRVVTETYENQKGEAIIKDLMDSYAGLSHNRLSDLTLDAAEGQKDCVVADGSKFMAGDKVKIEDDNNSEWNEVASVSGNMVTMVNNLAHTYTVAANGKVTSELIEDTDTTYTLLEYKDTPVFDILKYIAESADKSGVIGFDFRVEHDGKFRFFPRDSKTSPISLSEKIEYSRYSKDIHRVRNRIIVYGAAEKPYPLDIDGQPWSDSLTENLTKPDNYLQHDDGKWEPVTGNTNLYVATSPVHTGSKSVKAECTAYMYYMGIAFTFNSDKYVNCNKYPRLCFTLREDDAHNQKVTVSLEDKDGNTCRQVVNIAEYDEWQAYQFGVGKLNEESWSMSVFNSGDFDWEYLKEVRFDFHQKGSSCGVAFVDRMHFGGCRWNAAEEDSASQSSYGLRELTETDEELHSDNECSLRATALLNHLSQPAEFLTLRSGVIDYGADRLFPGDKTHVTLPNEDIDTDYRITSVEYRVTARDQTLEITLELGKEKPLLADYLYGLRSTTVTLERLARTKAGLASVALGGGGGGGGGQVDEKVKASSDDTTTDFLLQKLLAGTGIALSEDNPGGDEKVRIDAHRKWSWADEQGQVKTFRLPFVEESGVNGWTRYSGNPVVSIGSSGQFDYMDAMHPDAIYRNKKCYIFYCGRNTALAEKRQIGLATSTDFVTFTKSASNPILKPTDWRPTGVYLQVPCVVYDEVDGKWKFWGDLYDTGWTNHSLAYAENPNTEPDTGWTNFQTLTMPADFSIMLAVLRLGNLWYLLYLDGAWTILKIATSEDGINNITYRGDALGLGDVGNWDDGHIHYATIFWNLGVAYVFYSGWRGALGGWNTAEIGMAHQRGTMQPNYTRWWLENGKVLTHTTGWESNAVYKPSLFMLNEKFYMFYNGYDGTRHRIGYATIP